MPWREHGRSEKENHKRAFEVYYAQGATRSFAKVAGELGVSVASLKSWSRLFGWRERIAEREAEVNRQIADKALASGVIDGERNLKIVRAALMKLAKGIVDGTIKPRIDDLPRLIQLEQDLVFGPSTEPGGHAAPERARVVVYIPDNGRGNYTAEVTEP